MKYVKYFAFKLINLQWTESTYSSVSHIATIYSLHRHSDCRNDCSYCLSRICRDQKSATMVSASLHDNTLIPRNPDGMHRPTTSLDGEGREQQWRQGKGGNDPDRWGWKIRPSVYALAWNWSWCWLNAWVVNKGVLYLFEGNNPEVAWGKYGMLPQLSCPSRSSSKTWSVKNLMAIKMKIQFFS